MGWAGLKLVDVVALSGFLADFLINNRFYLLFNINNRQIYKFAK